MTAEDEGWVEILMAANCAAIRKARFWVVRVSEEQAPAADRGRYNGATFW
jgi:hypothetical protein